MTISKRLLTGGLLRGLALIVSAAVALIQMPILVHSLGAKTYGLWVLASTLVSYFGMTDIGLSGAVGQFFAAGYGANDRKRMSTVFSTSLALYSGLFILVVILTLVLAFFSTLWFSSPEEGKMFSLVITLLGMTFAVQFPTRVSSGVLFSLVRHDILVAGMIAENLTRAGLTIWAVTHEHGLIALAAITLSTNTLESVWEFIWARKLCPEVKIAREFVSGECGKALLRYSSVAFVSNMASAFRLQSLPILVTKLVSLEAIVLFSIAQRFLTYCSQLAKSVSDMLASQFSRFHSSGESEKVQEMALIATSFATCAAGYIGLSIAIYGEAFVQAWMGPAYTESAFLMMIFAVPVCVEIITNPSKELLFGVNRLGGLALLHIGELLCVLVASSIGGYWLGLRGISMGFVIGVVPLELIGIPYLVSKHFQTPSWSQIKPVIGILLKWALASVVLYSMIHPFVKPSFRSLILWNVIQLVISIPIIYFSLPKMVRVRLANLLYSHSGFDTIRG